MIEVNIYLITILHTNLDLTLPERHFFQNRRIFVKKESAATLISVVSKLRRLSGGPKGARTLDLCVANAALSQLSYWPAATFYATATINILRLFLIPVNKNFFRQRFFRCPRPGGAVSACRPENIVQIQRYPLPPRSPRSVFPI